MRIAAVIVSRKSSKRIPHKSKKKIQNFNLIERKIIQLKKVKKFDKIYLGTNDISLKKIAKKYKIYFVKREKNTVMKKN